MALAQTYQSQIALFRGGWRSSFDLHRHSTITNTAANTQYSYECPRKYLVNYDNSNDFPRNFTEHDFYSKFAEAGVVPATKRRKFSAATRETSMRPYVPSHAFSNGPLTNRNSSGPYQPPSSKCDSSRFEGEDLIFMSRDEIERCSPSRKDGGCTTGDTPALLILKFPSESWDSARATTIGTAMVLCHRLFVRRSHARHDRFLISTAALFLSAKSEETACPLNNVWRASCEILHNQDFSLLSYHLPLDWFEQYRERVTEAEQIILTTLNFELNVQHPYASLTSTLDKLGRSEPILANSALSLVNEGLRSSLWLQFKPHQIAAGAAYLSAKSMYMDLASCVWREFQTPPSVLEDVVQQVMELF